ncbi:hypothetical protein [Sediminicoccus sp. KRV36]|uniref:hypothetical protein n=1 Tax=Sediminicoccus sp. KRV36 TaxID=3133721 RepID=UPI00200F2FC4|nr:hypothetical protein [Sediminicoccus rosea]UPY38947.1 hypothetical protein LHU95_09705 [Sediminicoccus rosea]
MVDVTEANAALDEIGSTMRDALLNWPARLSGLIAAEISVDEQLFAKLKHLKRSASREWSRRPNEISAPSSISLVQPNAPTTASTQAMLPSQHGML